MLKNLRRLPPSVNTPTRNGDAAGRCNGRKCCIKESALITKSALPEIAAHRKGPAQTLYPIAWPYAT